MKKLATILFAFALVLTLCACGEDAATSDESDADGPTSIMTESDTEESADEGKEQEATQTSAPDTEPVEPEEATEADDTEPSEDTPTEPEAPTTEPAEPSKPTEATATTPAVIPATGDPTSQPTEPDAPTEPAEPAEPTESAEPAADPKTIAESYIDKSVSALKTVIGEPSSSDYAPSCLGDGEDGELLYNGFTVYTYREGDKETVTYVE